MTNRTNARLRQAAGPAALLALYYVMAVSAVSQKSMTFDEMAHLTAGHSYWAFNDYRLHPENGNWPQRLGALPAIVGGAAFPGRDQPAWTRSNVYALGDQYLYSSGNDAGRLLQRGRAVMALLGVALGAVVFAWARRLISPAAGWLALTLFVFSPTLLAHGPLVTSDVAAALFFTAATGALWSALHRVTPLTVLGGAVLAAGAFLSKLSAPILVPVAMLVIAVRVASGRPLVIEVRKPPIRCEGRARVLAVAIGVAAVFALVTWALIWVSFGLRFSAFAAPTTGQDAFLGQVADQPGIVGWILSTARHLRLLPEAYLYGVGLTLQYSSERAAFLNGEFGTTGWWWYFPYAFAVKTTIPALLVGALALAGLAARWRSASAEDRAAHVRDSLYAGTPLLALVIVYSVFALTTNLNIGHRHLLPIYPALCILAGGAAAWIQRLFERPGSRASQAGRGRARRSAATDRQPRRRWITATGIATLTLVAWHVVESVAVSPSYLAYFNQLAGGPAQGYKHLADSSLDWGQDLPALKRWLDARGLQGDAASRVYLSYFGTARPEYYGIQATRLAGFIDRRPPQAPVPLTGGVYCVSATVLDVIGHTFYRGADEREYQAALKNLAAFARASEHEQTWTALIRQTGEPYWHRLFARFDQLRTGRLVAFLRNRQPDDMVGYSILIYRLSDADVASALTGPVPPGAGEAGS